MLAIQAGTAVLFTCCTSLLCCKGREHSSLCRIPLSLSCCFLCGHRYEDALVLLLTEVLNRIQFRYNQAQLEELDDETLDDDVRGRAEQGQLQVQM